MSESLPAGPFRLPPLTAAAPEAVSGRGRLTAVSRAVHGAVAIMRVGGEYYYKDQAGLYRPLRDQTLKGWVRDFWRAAFADFSPRDITDAVEVIKLDTDEEAESLDNGCIMVSKHIYWDKEAGALRHEPSGPVFYRLFETTYPTKHVVKVPPFNAKQEEALWERYYSTLKELEAGQEIERYECLQVWAAGSHDVYMDLHRAHAYMFLKKKPMGAYILIGLRRNGKSAFVGMTSTIMGGDNSSNVQLGQLGDPHYTHQLRHALVNAPDEEEEKAVSYQGFFKGLALDTPIPTPNGYTTMAELQRGDLVLDKDYNIVPVLHKSVVHMKPCYKVSFSKYEQVVADFEHRWLVSVDGSEDIIQTTEQLARLLSEGHTVEINDPVAPATSNFATPIDPYLLGVWVASGDADCNLYPNNWTMIRKRLGQSHVVEGHTVVGLEAALKLLKIRDYSDVPYEYIYGSYSTRKAFVQGLMDSMGWVDNSVGYIRTGNEEFAYFLMQALSAAGYQPMLEDHPSDMHGVYLISFYNDGRCSTKARTRHPLYTQKRRVRAVDPTETVPTQCIEVDSPSHTYLFGHEHIVTHNTLADHGALSLPVMRSNTPLRLNCDFMCFFPMNHTPEWSGTGASACLERSLVIPFNADLSRYDKTTNNFAEETFTADFMADYMGSVFAYANYYSRHDLVYSPTMLSERGAIEEDLDNCLVYRYQFEKFFNSFTNFSLVYDDYNRWCQANDLKIKTRKELKFVFRQYFSNRSTTNMGGMPVKVYRGSQAQGSLFSEFFYAREVGDVKTNHEKNCSMVERLVAYYTERGVNL